MLTRLFKEFIRGEEGATMLEYALMVGLITAALVAAVQALSGVVGGKFAAAQNGFNGSSTGSGH